MKTYQATDVNPSRLEPALRAAVCEQCHLQGQVRVLRRGRGVFDFRPGLPLEQFWAVFEFAQDESAAPKAVGQVEQMQQSRCFQASDGALGCSSCHDPHRLPAAEDDDGPMHGGRLEDILAAQTDVLERIVRGDDLAAALGQLVSWIEATSDADVAGSEPVDLRDREHLRQSGLLKVVEPDTAITMIREYIRNVPVTHYYSWTLPPGLPPRWAQPHLELFASKVIPAFR